MFSRISYSVILVLSFFSIVCSGAAGPASKKDCANYYKRGGSGIFGSQNLQDWGDDDPCEDYYEYKGHNTWAIVGITVGSGLFIIGAFILVCYCCGCCCCSKRRKKARIGQLLPPDTVSSHGPVYQNYESTGDTSGFPIIPGPSGDKLSYLNTAYTSDSGQNFPEIYQTPPPPPPYSKIDPHLMEPIPNAPVEVEPLYRNENDMLNDQRQE